MTSSSSSVWLGVYRIFCWNQRVATNSNHGLDVETIELESKGSREDGHGREAAAVHPPAIILVLLRI